MARARDGEKGRTKRHQIAKNTKRAGVENNFVSENPFLELYFASPTTLI